jgi:anaerobic magnesium-protoporphyrin IX monomethyl ester cyclase
MTGEERYFMRILLAKCPRAYQSHFEENSESLALAYLAAALRRQSWQVDIVDAALTGLDVQETVARIVAREYELIGFTIGDPSYVWSTFEVIKAIRAKGISSHITIGGYTPTFNWKETLEACPELDSVVMYEGEEAVVDLATAIENQTDWHNIQNLAFRKNRQVTANPARQLIKDLDALPFPARDTLPYILEHKKETGVISVYASRGCYANCGFCSIRAFYDGPFGSPWRTRSVKNIVDEIEHLVSHWGVEEILFVDDVFIGPGKKGIERAFQLADEIERRGLRVMFSISERVDNATYDIFKRLYDIGVRQTLLGVEAGTQESLDLFNKKTTLDQNKYAISLLHHLGIDVTVSFINFSVQTTMKELRRNLSFLLGLNVNFLQGLLNRFTIYHGTPMAKEMYREGKVKGSFPDYTYDFENKQVEIAYRVVRNSLGPFLSTAYELKRLERKFRLKMFNAQIRGDDISSLVDGKKQFKFLEASIMKEASGIFSSILDFAESCSQIPERDVFLFTDYVAELAGTRFVQWNNQIKFFETFVPCFTEQLEEETCLT